MIYSFDKIYCILYDDTPFNYEMNFMKILTSKNDFEIYGVII